MKNLLSKRNVSIFFLAILTLAVLILLSPSIAERAELRRIANMNKKVIPVTYDFIYDERPEYVGDARVEYIWPTKREEAEIYLPGANEARTVNVAVTNNVCNVIMDYPEYTANVKFIKYSPYNAAVSFYPSGEIRVSSDIDIDFHIYFENKNDPIQTILYFKICAQDAKVSPYENGFVIDDYNKLLEVCTYRYESFEKRERLAYRSFYAKTQDILIKSDVVWITPVDSEDHTAIMVDTFNIGVFDTDAAYLWEVHFVE